MYAGPADVTFFHRYQPLPPEQLDVYYYVALEIRLTKLAPDRAQLQLAPGLIGVEDATHVRVRLPDGVEFEGEIHPTPNRSDVTSLLFTLQRVEDLSDEVYR